jgi:hypothetical protein
MQNGSQANETIIKGEGLNGTLEVVQNEYASTHKYRNTMEDGMQ